jgi:hypothetical protein
VTVPVVVAEEAEATMTLESGGGGSMTSLDDGGSFASSSGSSPKKQRKNTSKARKSTAAGGAGGASGGGAPLPAVSSKQAAEVEPASRETQNRETRDPSRRGGYVALFRRLREAAKSACEPRGRVVAKPPREIPRHAHCHTIDRASGRQTIVSRL